MSEKKNQNSHQSDDQSTMLEIELKAVIDGEIIKVEEISDPVFSSKMIGDGYGIIPTGKKLYSPVAGKIEEIALTKHAVYLSTKDDIKLLIHLGIDTIQLKGEGFETTIEKDMFVEAGDLLISFDPDFVIKEGLIPVVSVIILDKNEKQMDIVVYPATKAIANETVALEAKIYE